MAFSLWPLNTAGIAAGVTGRSGTTRLAPGIRVERELSGAEFHAYRIAAAAGDFIHLTIEQRGIDVAVTLIRPDGRDVVAVDASRDDVGSETVVAVADVSGAHVIKVRRAPTAGARGRYAIQLEDMRAATADDAVRVDAERAFERGRALLLTARPAAYGTALDEFHVAIDRYHGLRDRPGELKTAIEIAGAEALLVRPGALRSAQFAVELAQEVGAPPDRARALRMLGRALERAGDRPAALRAYEEASALLRGLHDPFDEALTVNDEGIIYGQTGDAEQAVVKFERALALARAARRDLSPGVLNNLGIAYKDLGQYEKSLDAYERAVARARTDHDRSLEATILNNMGNVARLQGRHEAALKLHTTALALSRETGGRENEARSLNTVGQTYYALGDYARALDYHRQALAIRRELADLAAQAASLEGVGRALHRLGNSAQALDALHEALSIRQAIHEQYGEPATLRNLAIVERDQGDLATALRDATAAVDFDETLRARITSPELRATYVAAEQDKYELLIDVLQALHTANPAAGHAAAALTVSERARSRVLLESLLDARVDLRQGIDPALLERERSLQTQLGAASAQLSRSLSGRGRETPAQSPAQELERLTAEYQRLETEIRERSPRYAALTQPRPLDAAEIQESVLDDETVLLEYALGEDRSWLWVVTTHAVLPIELPPHRAIDAMARSLYERFTARQPREGEAAAAYAARVATADRRLRGEAAAASRMLLGGIAVQLNGEWRNKRLAIVASGALQYLPFAALPVPPADPTAAAAPRLVPRVPLSATHEIVTIPSASVVAVLRRETAGRPAARPTVAIVADPVFDAGDPRVAARRDAAGPPAHASVSSSGDAHGAHATRALSRLPFSRDEANAIAALVGPRDTLKATDFTASRATVLSAALSRQRIVHLATHGIVDSLRPSLSALVLSLVDEHGGRQNGYLRLPDIYNMRLDADLVVLSACQTALGKEIRGEGLVGLTRAFFYAGAPRVVASLWEVNDLATAELMKRFYRAMLQEHLRPAAALRAAQSEMSHDPRWASPYFWAGFVLQGEWR